MTEMADRSTSPLQKLRPGKIGSAVRRRWFEWTLQRAPGSGRGEPAEVGSSYGGWMLPRAVIRPGWTCYCVGAGGDISFDLELVETYGATVRCIEPDETYTAEAIAEAADMQDRFQAVRAALAGADAPIRMQRTHHPGSRSLSSARLYDTQEFVEVPGRTLQSLMSEAGDSTVDLLKVDIEGAEYEVIPKLDLRALGVKVLSIQLHHNRGMGAARRLIAGIEACNFELVAALPPVRLTFVDSDLLAAHAAESAGSQRPPGEHAEQRHPPAA